MFILSYMLKNAVKYVVYKPRKVHKIAMVTWPITNGQTNPNKWRVMMTYICTQDKTGTDDAEIEKNENDDLQVDKTEIFINWWHTSTNSDEFKDKMKINTISINIDEFQDKRKTKTKCWIPLNDDLNEIVWTYMYATVVQLTYTMYFEIIRPIWELILKDIQLQQTFNVQPCINYLTKPWSLTALYNLVL